MNAFMSFLMLAVSNILSRIANELWQAVWEKVFEAVAEAEKKWTESGQGKLKRDWVVAQVTQFITDQAAARGKKLGWIERLLLSLFAGSVADALVGYVNDTLGKDWRAKAEAFEQEWADRLPVIE